MGLCNFLKEIIKEIVDGFICKDMHKAEFKSLAHTIGIHPFKNNYSIMRLIREPKVNMFH